jgi:hypothetical protein
MNNSKEPATAEHQNNNRNIRDVTNIKDASNSKEATTGTPVKAV